MGLGPCQSKQNWLLLCSTLIVLPKVLAKNWSLEGWSGDVVFSPSFSLYLQVEPPPRLYTAPLLDETRHLRGWNYRVCPVKHTLIVHNLSKICPPCFWKRKQNHLLLTFLKQQNNTAEFRKTLLRNSTVDCMTVNILYGGKGEGRMFWITYMYFPNYSCFAHLIQNTTSFFLGFTAY